MQQRATHKREYHGEQPSTLLSTGSTPFHRQGAATYAVAPTAGDHQITQFSWLSINKTNNVAKLELASYY